MSKIKKLITGGFGLIALGYALGILTAPKSGKQTRKTLKNTNKNALPDIERDLKTIYSQTKTTLDKLATNNPELADRYKAAKRAADSSQEKIKQLLSAINGQDNVDEDLAKVLSDAKQVLADLNKYLKK
ncbi:MAG: hypothetical protein ACYCPS_00290 [Candidatus Saccharimonadales bacterium]